MDDEPENTIPQSTEGDQYMSKSITPTAAQVTLDAAGQPGGPSLEEQDAVNKEQRALIDRMRAEREPLELQDRQKLQERIDKALAQVAQQRSIIARVDALEARVKALESR